MTATAFRKLRLSHKLTQAETAKLLGYKRRQTISDIELGKNKINSRNAKAIKFMFSAMLSDRLKEKE